MIRIHPANFTALFAQSAAISDRQQITYPLRLLVLTLLPLLIGLEMGATAPREFENSAHAASSLIGMRLMCIV